MIFIINLSPTATNKATHKHVDVTRETDRRTEGQKVLKTQNTIHHDSILLQMFAIRTYNFQ
jgi:hypothetical protein